MSITTINWPLSCGLLDSLGIQRLQYDSWLRCIVVAETGDEQHQSKMSTPKNSILRTMNGVSNPNVKHLIRSRAHRTYEILMFVSKKMPNIAVIMLTCIVHIVQVW